MMNIVIAVLLIAGLVNADGIHRKFTLASAKTKSSAASGSGRNPSYNSVELGHGEYLDLSEFKLKVTQRGNCAASYSVSLRATAVCHYSQHQGCKINYASHSELQADSLLSDYNMINKEAKKDKDINARIGDAKKIEENNAHEHRKQCTENSLCSYSNEEDFCYPKVDGDTMLDAKTLVDRDYTSTFTSTGSQLLSVTDALENKETGRPARRWTLDFWSLDSTDASCNFDVDLDVHTMTNGGKCSIRNMAACDQEAVDCQLTPQPDRPTEKTENTFFYCSCLKQQELCYRRTSCRAGNHNYEGILTACVRNNCGNGCSSHQRLDNKW